MSAGNVEVVRRGLEAYARLVRQDSAQYAAEFWDPDGDYYPVRKFPEARPCHGREEISRFLFKQLEAWSRYDHAIKELISVGDDRVLVHARLLAEGRESGLRVDGDLYQCFWLRHGRFLRVEDHLTMRGALHGFGLDGETLEAVGLQE